MYSSRFVLSVVSGGRVLAERHDGTVPIPFGSEYSLRLRNKHDRRTVVTFTIDGEDVSGAGYVIPARSCVEISRHASHDAAFRFVSLESEEAASFGKSENARGEKGVIEARFFLEKIAPVAQVIHHYYEHPPWRPYPYPTYRPWPQPYVYGCQSSAEPTYSGQGGGIHVRSGSLGQVNLKNAPSEVSEGGLPTMDSPPVGSLTDGCTVEGDSTGQRFRSVHLDLETDYVPLRVVLRGYVPTPEQVEALTEAPHTHCTGCGAKRSRKSDRFCGGCGHRF